ncbi:hypothetical protein ACJIZ3_012210 [Penstemon smallii]|uniref:Uncharacterized protein n=1 Tax=Penstemon smallii TaxID=265156 RepID=A0ABD3UP82_9LAMI
MAGQNWGRADNLRYDCCFICVDASLPELDRYVEQRVDLMVDSGLLREVCDIYKSNADYTRGLRQAIGVREFEDFLKYYWKSERQEPTNELDVHQIMKSFTEDQPKVLMLKEATEKVKLNTRRLLRRQRRRLSRLQMMYGWDIHYIDVTSCISCASEKLWNANVVEPSVKIIKSFLDKQNANSEEGRKSCDEEIKLEPQRDFWTLYICQACSNKELRGAHEWEQHKQGKGHRKRVCRLRKSGILSQKNRLD